MNVSSFSTNHSRFEFSSNSARLRGVVALSLSACIAGLSFLQSGCVALNIPSQRHHDPADSGGILGSWEDPVRPGRVLKEVLMGPPPEDGLDNCDDFHAFGSEQAGGPHASEPETPEVPWPKYHPVPTRPVFGS